ncbi:hypothetical protein ScPMuIL_015134 [Solemya velum]
MANTFNGIRTKEEETVIRPAASKGYGEHRGGDRALTNGNCRGVTIALTQNPYFSPTDMMTAQLTQTGFDPDNNEFVELKSVPVDSLLQTFLGYEHMGDTSNFVDTPYQYTSGCTYDDTLSYFNESLPYDFDPELSSVFYNMDSSSKDEDNDSVMLDESELEDLDSHEWPGSTQDLSVFQEQPSSSNLPSFTVLARSLATPHTDYPHRGGSEGSESEGDDYDQEVVFPKGRRGAKNVLLWKFLLQKLDDRTDLIQWIDIRKGVFKFLDTQEVSRLWGEKKRKQDMNFEKLSRGIRHYYKDGLMSRVFGTRLVYQFHWNKIPRAFRKV